MPRSNRGEGTEALAWALVACLTIVLLLSLLFPPLPSADYKATHDGYATECANAESGLARFRNADPADSQSSESEAEKTQKEKAVTDWCDLSAQHLAAKAGAKSANFTRLATIAAVFGILLLIVTVVQTSGMLREAKKTASVTREVGETAERATLRVTQLVRRQHQNRMVAEHEGPSNRLTAKIGYFGRSSAYNVLILATGSFDTWKTGVERWDCTVIDRRKMEVDKSTSAIIVFDFKKIRAMQMAGNCIVPAMLTFEIEIFYEDVFTIGTDREINFTRQEFRGAARGHTFESVGRLEMGKQDRARYEGYLAEFPL